VQPVSDGRTTALAGGPADAAEADVIRPNPNQRDS
jgi:hypothetical protein